MPPMLANATRPPCAPGRSPPGPDRTEAMPPRSLPLRDRPSQSRRH
jgi:hypothetical protein